MMEASSISALNATKWRIELHEGRESDFPTKLEPIGYFKNLTVDKELHGTAATKSAQNTQELKKKRAMEIGSSPFKSLLQTGLMMWMSGSSINIFSIMITGMIVMNTIKSLVNVQNAFSSVDDGTIDLMQPKLTYVAGNLVNVAAALYKLGNMGLLPTTSADWTWLLPIKEALETSAYAIDIPSAV